MTDREAYIAFNLTDHIGSVKVAELASRAGSVAAAWEVYPNKTARTGGEVDWAREFDLATKYAVQLLTPADEGYPSSLLSAPGHPLALYVKGDVAALSRASVALIGTRRATAYGLDQAYRLGHDLAARGWCVVSGLALGIDAESHRGALAAGGLTVGIIGSGLDRFYPEENRPLARELVEKGGAVVSEFPFGRSPDTQTFPQRNHVVAALARGVVAIEAPIKSGTLITTAIAGDLGRAVMAVPGRVDSRSSAGCLQLIREGARLVRSAADVEEELSDLIPLSQRPAKASQKGALRPKEGLSAAPQPVKPSVTLEESLILRELDAEGVSMDELVRRTRLSPAKVSSLTMTLRVRGLVRFFPGNRVALPREC